MIKKLVTITALAMLLGSPNSYATFKSGNDLAKDCWSDSGFSKGICAGYVIGLTDILSGEGRICAPSTVTLWTRNAGIELSRASLRVSGTYGQDTSSDTSGVVAMSVDPSIKISNLFSAVCLLVQR